MKNPVTRNSYGSCVNRNMNEYQLRLQNELRNRDMEWPDIDKRINMKQLSYTECLNLVRDTYNEIRVHSDAAEQVTMMIIAHESGHGKYRRQIGAKNPALGLGQMEEQTFDTVMKYGDRIRSYLNRADYNYNHVKFSDLETDDVLAIIFIRARLAMDTKPLPSIPKYQALYCKSYWNAGGKATAQKYLNDWESWKND